MDPVRYFLSREDTETKRTPHAWSTVNMTQTKKKSDGVLRLNPRSSTSSFLSRVIVAWLAVFLWGADAKAQDEVATLLNLSPWQSYVHLFCDKTGGAACAVSFRCGQQSGDPVAWNVAVEPSRIFTYWPNKTDGAGRAADLEAALVNAGLTYIEARRRTTCTVRSNDPVDARAYTFFAGELTPVANTIPKAGDNKVATLLNLSPWQSYVHLFCDKTGGAACAVSFRCGQQSGDPVAWNVAVEPSRIFTYWPNKTDGAGRAAGLEAALVNAGLTSTEARRRTTCTVRSNDPVKARAYTFLAGQLVPVANVNTVQSDGPRQPEPANVALSDLVLLRLDNANPVTLVPPFSSDTTSYAATVPYSVDAVSVVATATNTYAGGISGFLMVNGTSAFSGVPSGPIQLTAGQTTTISITLTGSDASTRTYRIAVTRQEDARTPPPGPNTRRGTISFDVTDTCNDRRRVEFRFFESINGRLTGHQWPRDNRIYHTLGFNREGVSHLACTVGTGVCFGAKIDGRSWYWGVGLEGNRRCTDCCYTCTAAPETVRLHFGCPS